MVFRIKIGLSVVVVVDDVAVGGVVVGGGGVVNGQPKQHKLPETHFSESQTSSANRRSYMKPSLRVKINTIF